MNYGNIIDIFNETNLSPEELAPWIGISNSTYRRWQKSSRKELLQKEYYENVVAGIYKLLSAGKLSYESPLVGRFLERHVPEFFSAAIGQFKNTEEVFSENASHQDKISTLLTQLGSVAKIRLRVNKSIKEISTFKKWGADWKSRIKLLLSVITSKKIALIDQFVAYGALFYLVLPFDLVPDAIPVFGYIDDFGILGFATQFYARRLPDSYQKPV